MLEIILYLAVVFFVPGLLIYLLFFKNRDFLTLSVIAVALSIIVNFLIIIILSLFWEVTKDSLLITYTITIAILAIGQIFGTLK